MYVGRIISILGRKTSQLDPNTGLNKKIFVEKSVLGGKGLFAKNNIYKGEIIHTVISEYPKVYIKNLAKWPIDKREMFLHFAFQGGNDFYYGDPNLFLADDSFFMNHSCDPNCWFKNENTLIANRRIKKGEELTIDYATFMTPAGLERPFICHCDGQNCRKIIKNTDCLIEEVSSRYKNHVMPHVTTYLKENKQSDTIDRWTQKKNKLSSRTKVS